MLMFARSAMSERTATLSPRWTASANRESAAKTGTPSITDKLTIRSAFRLIRAPPRQSQVTDETGFRGIASRLHAAVKQAVAIQPTTALAEILEVEFLFGIGFVGPAAHAFALYSIGRVQVAHVRDTAPLLAANGMLE